MVLALAAAVAGCKPDHVVETQVLAFAESRACMEAGATLGMNSYVVRLYEFTPPPPEMPAMAPPCVDCLGSGRCRPLLTQCRCSMSVPVGTLGLNQGLANFRFTDLDPRRHYCIALLAFDQPGLVPPGPMPPPPGSWDCPCAFSDAGAPPALRLCGLSPFPGTVGENAGAIILAADCPDPMRPTCFFPIAAE